MFPTFADILADPTKSPLLPHHLKLGDDGDESTASGGNSEPPLSPDCFNISVDQALQGLGLDQKPVVSPSSGNAALPSVGSAGHASGQCSPCCFHPRGRCVNGQDCSFCHFGHEKRRRKKRGAERGANGELTDLSDCSMSPTMNGMPPSLLDVSGSPTGGSCLSSPGAPPPAPAYPAPSMAFPVGGSAPPSYPPVPSHVPAPAPVTGPTEPPSAPPRLSAECLASLSVASPTAAASWTIGPKSPPPMEPPKGFAPSFEPDQKQVCPPPPVPPSQTVSPKLHFQELLQPDLQQVFKAPPGLPPSPQRSPLRSPASPPPGAPPGLSGCRSPGGLSLSPPRSPIRGASAASPQSLDALLGIRTSVDVAVASMAGSTSPKHAGLDQADKDALIPRNKPLKVNLMRYECSVWHTDPTMPAKVPMKV